LSGDGRAAELARLARELAELKAVAPPEEAPFLRIALEAIEAALASATVPRLHATREASRLVRIRTESALSQARALVAEARARIAGLPAIREEPLGRGNSVGSSRD